MQDVQQGKAPQVRWLAVAEQFRAGDGDVAFHDQQFTAAMRGGFQAEADLAVDFRQARVAALVGDAEVDIRVALAKPAQVGGQPAGGPGRRGDNAQALAQVGHAHGVEGAFDMVEGIAQVRGEGEAGSSGELGGVLEISRLGEMCAGPGPAGERPQVSGDGGARGRELGLPLVSESHQRALQKQVEE